MIDNRIDEYQQAYMADYGFERVMVHYRRKLLMQRLADIRPRIVVEIGCGSELLCEAWSHAGHEVNHWLIVEPGDEFAAIARKSTLPGVRVIQDYFENARDEILKTLPERPDLVICAGLLHEVPSADAMLQAIRSIMGPSSILHVNVPNANSLHRRIAQAMGLIEDAKALSAQNRKLFQRHVYDMADLQQELSANDFDIRNSGGHLIKPFTHAQMEAIAGVIGSDILDGLFKLGQDIPALASEIYVEAKLK